MRNVLCTVQCGQARVRVRTRYMTTNYFFGFCRADKVLLVLSVWVSPPRQFAEGRWTGHCSRGQSFKLNGTELYCTVSGMLDVGAAALVYQSIASRKDNNRKQCWVGVVSIFYLKLQKMGNLWRR